MSRFPFTECGYEPDPDRPGHVRWFSREVPFDLRRPYEAPRMEDAADCDLQFRLAWVRAFHSRSPIPIIEQMAEFVADHYEFL